MRVLTAILVALVLSCGSDPSGWATDYAGNWHLAVAEAPGCWPAFGLEFTVPQADVDVATDELFNTFGAWHFTGSATGGTITGNINRQAPSFALQFHQGSFATRVSGTAVTSTRLTGTFQDPDGILHQPAGCTATAEATH